MDFEMVAEFDAGPDLDAVGHIGVIARLLDDRSVAIAILYRYVNGLAIGQDDGNLMGRFACQ